MRLIWKENPIQMRRRLPYSQPTIPVTRRPAVLTKPQFSKHVIVRDSHFNYNLVHVGESFVFFRFIVLYWTRTFFFKLVRFRLWTNDSKVRSMHWLDHTYSGWASKTYCHRFRKLTEVDSYAKEKKKRNQGCDRNLQHYVVISLPTTYK